MNNVFKNKVTAIASASMLAMLSACSDGGGSAGGDNSGNSINTGGTTTIVSNDFTFPAAGAANGALTEIPAGPKPAFPARRTLSAGGGSVIEFGDPVVLSYEMYSWTTGALVETTADFEDPITVQAGVSDGLPDYLSNSLLGRNIGDKMQIIFQPGMEDLPEYLDSEDAYVVLLDLI